MEDTTPTPEPLGAGNSKGSPGNDDKNVNTGSTSASTASTSANPSSNGTSTSEISVTIPEPLSFQTSQSIQPTQIGQLIGPEEESASTIPLFLRRIHASRPIPPETPGTPLVPQPLYLPPPALPAVEEDLVPPENFALVSPGVYRCGFPLKKNFAFLETLRLKTVLWVVFFSILHERRSGTPLTPEHWCWRIIPKPISNGARARISSSW